MYNHLKFNERKICREEKHQGIIAKMQASSYVTFAWAPTMCSGVNVLVATLMTFHWFNKIALRYLSIGHTHLKVIHPLPYLTLSGSSQKNFFVIPTPEAKFFVATHTPLLRPSLFFNFTHLPHLPLHCHLQHVNH